MYVYICKLIVGFAYTCVSRNCTLCMQTYNYIYIYTYTCILNRDESFLDLLHILL